MPNTSFQAHISIPNLKSIFSAKEAAPTPSHDQNHACTGRRKRSAVNDFSEVESYELFDAGAQAAAESEAWNRRTGKRSVQIYGTDDQRS
jgi:hypothetical protein